MRIARLIAHLCWHWSLPFVLGGIFAYFVMAFQMTTLFPELETAFMSAIDSYCGPLQ